MDLEAHIVHSGELTEPNPPASLGGGVGKMWRDLWGYKYLVSNFVQSDLRVKYRNSALGYVWSLLEPLLLSGVYVVLFSIIAGKPQKLYPLWVILGVLTWGCFSRSVLKGVSSLTGNEGTIKAIFFPRSLFAIAPVCSQLVMTSLSLFVAVPFMIYFGIAPTRFLLMVPLALLLIGMLALGIGMAMACINVVNRDVEHLFRFLMRAGLYISPVLWTVDMVPASRKAAMDYLMLNPMVVPITMIRNGITGQPLTISTGYVACSVVACVATFLVGVMIFQRYEARIVKKI
jgi:ABC-type polysaccharide/polyol phosphate export permease